MFAFRGVHVTRVVCAAKWLADVLHVLMFRWLQAFGRITYLSTSFKRVPRGTEGAVSLEGTAAGLAAALSFSAVATALDLVRSLPVSQSAVNP